MSTENPLERKFIKPTEPSRLRGSLIEKDRCLELSSENLVGRKFIQRDTGDVYKAERIVEDKKYGDKIILRNEKGTINLRLSDFLAKLKESGGPWKIE